MSDDDIRIATIPAVWYRPTYVAYVRCERCASTIQVERRTEHEARTDLEDIIGEHVADCTGWRQAA